MSALTERVQSELDYLNEPGARWEMGEAARWARLVALAETEVPRLLAEIASLRRVLFADELPTKEQVLAAMEGSEGDSEG